MIRLRFKKLIYMEGGYMLVRIKSWFIVKWEYLKFYSMNVDKWWLMFKLKYFNKENEDV